MYHFTLHRPRESYKDFILSGHNIRLPYRAGMESGFAILGRALQHLNMADGGVRITESNGGEYAASLPSSARLAMMPVGECPLTPALYVFLSSPHKNHLSLIARDLVADGRLTEKGQEAMRQHEASLTEEAESQDRLIWLTPGQLSAFELVRDGKIRQWNALHGKTKNFMVRSGWVTIVEDKPVITDSGQAVWDRFMRKHEECSDSVR